jgi:hypothetical protein
MSEDEDDDDGERSNAPAVASELLVWGSRVLVGFQYGILFVGIAEIDTDTLEARAFDVPKVPFPRAMASAAGVVHVAGYGPDGWWVARKSMSNDAWEHDRCPSIASSDVPVDVPPRASIFRPFLWLAPREESADLIVFRVADRDRGETPTGLHVMRRGVDRTWRERFVVPAGPRNFDGHAVSVGDRLLVGTNHGEFGGDLLLVETRDEIPRELRAIGIRSDDGPDNVVGLREAGAGKIWIARGLGHMGTMFGALELFENSRLTRIAMCHAMFGDTKRVSGWPLTPGAFEALTVDRRGRPIVAWRHYVKTGDPNDFLRSRLARLETDGWRELTAEPMRDIAAIEMLSEHELVGLGRGTVFIVDLRDGSVRERPCEPPATSS